MGLDAVTRERKKSQSLSGIKPRFIGHPDRSLVTIVTELWVSLEAVDEREKEFSVCRELNPDSTAIQTVVWSL
jgi:hypothetical protein